MKDKEIIKQLKKKEHLKNKDIAEILKVTDSYISAVLNDKSKFSDDTRDFLITKYNLIENQLNSTENFNITLNYYPNVIGSCGFGAFEGNNEVEKFSVSKNLIKSYSKNKYYSIINAIGDSMQPYIENHDKLIIEQYEGEQIKDNHIYFFSIDDEAYVKRLTKNVNELYIKSDNTDYNIITLQNEQINKVNIIGEVVGIIRNCL